MTRIFYSTWVKPACCVSKISSDGGCQSKETGVGMEVRLLSVGARGFFSRCFATHLRGFASSILSPTTRKKTSGTQGTYRVDSVYIYHFSRNLFEKPSVLYLTTYSEVLALFISYSDQTLYHSNFASSDLLHFFWVQSRLWLRKHLCSATSFPSQITISMISGNSCNREPLVRTATTLRAKSLKVSFVFNLV